MLTQLYLIPTPIGNLEDVTLRALRILKEVDVILAEDTRTSGKLLKHYDINKPLRSYHIFNEHKAVASLVQTMQEGKVMALMSDAGTPSISDPGFLLVRECLANGIQIECLPGATAFVPALVKSGLPSDKFIFEGFLPHKKGRQTRLEGISDEDRTVVLYESPHRLVKCLDQLIRHCGEERQASVSRELTKMHEETVNGTLKELKEHFDKGPIKGEIVIVLHGK
ncbi:16S rRNA (cytidine(1402)-2'-O)-methyltransferase [Fulvivirga sp. M361]|uniref:16S rRNA (cytidine(1402)-2'-O)-methyltransferase n=1 Tax=Fulvivirga sp. M361 TaxID=2594266 RepID=UPI001179E370|nr:16S rRNA (cytidine(1402)-2'-O)-methyltransferase [Fulvivirga sp. M361]TRX61326.1 16S rRNA (cytidine(1402)-2'-O)-methyltransferase [Fulvivirga sp. M361]